jgi:ribosomal protein L18E
MIGMIKIRKRVQLNAKVISLFYNALSVNEYNKITACEIAKQILDRLEMEHEGTPQVNESNIDRLMHQFEIFKMQEHEKITDMIPTHHKFIEIIKKNFF